MTQGPGDPLGRAAFFSHHEPADAEPAPATAGRHGLFSAPPREPGVVIVDCTPCGRPRPVPLRELLLVAVSMVWLPDRRFPRALPCPVCRDLGPCRIVWPDGGPVAAPAYA